MTGKRIKTIKKTKMEHVHQYINQSTMVSAGGEKKPNNIAPQTVEYALTELALRYTM